MWGILLIVAAIAAGYWKLAKTYNYWVKRGVKQATMTEILGQIWISVLRKKSIAETIQEGHEKFPNNRYVGGYQFVQPILFLRDPELIKQITVKDFDHFTDHQSMIPEDVDPLCANNLFLLTGQKWRAMRSTLSPVFTSSKMRNMFPLISKNGQQFVSHFLKKNEDIITLEMKDSFRRFTNDVIANTAFGVECDSLDDRNNEFFVMGKEATDFSGFWKFFKFFVMIIAPKIAKTVGFTFFSKEVLKFFNTVIKNNIENREKHGIVRPDMLHLLLEARKNGLKDEASQRVQDTGFTTVEEFEINKNNKNHKMELTDQDITSQALIFFFAGFDSVSSLMCFMSYELAVHADVQKRLIEEVDETGENCSGQLRYEALLSMKYLDMVVSETLRLWPNAVGVDRVCTKPYTIEPQYPDETPVHLEKDTPVFVPIYGIHRHSKYYADPDRFDPERFNDENKMNIRPYTYLPFGSGPRNCIGSRFALLETKALFFHILTHFEVVPVKKTQIPLKIDRKQFNLTAEGGFWLGLKQRVKI